MFAALFVIAGIVLLVLAGFNVRGPRFAPEWLGFACLAVAGFLSILTTALPR
jgi:drug/metabolite transporter (DMT)-like permease